MNTQKILITGASGYVGSRVYQDLKNSGYDVVGTYNNTKLFDDLLQVDITNEQEFKRFLEETSPTVIIHTAADAHTATCEADPGNAQSLNVDSTKHLVNYAKANKTRLIHLSTFACFNENATKVYPKTKIAAEKLVEELDNYVILRLSLVVGLSPNTTSKNFYNDLIEAYRSKTNVEADSSWQFEMSYLGNISKLIAQIIDNPDINKVMIPYVEQGVTSRYKITQEILQDVGCRAVETTSDRIIPLPELDLLVFNKFGLHRGNYEGSIAEMKAELKND